MIPLLIRKLIDGRGITPLELETAISRVMDGNVDPAQVAGLLVALAREPVQAPLLAAAARALSRHGVALHPQVRPLVDTCGTGGDSAGTFNISTAAAMVVASCGAAVAKHGNRGVSSPVGSADVIEATGAGLALSPARAREVLDATGFVFLFAPAFHPAMAHVAPVRRSLGVRTIFNLLGPLANPARADCQLLGVYDPALTGVMAAALSELGSVSALVVHCEGLDEIGLHAPTRGHRLRRGEIEAFELDPQDLGIARTPIEALRGGSAAENAALLRRALRGADGPHADVVAINAGAALEVAGNAPSIEAGVERARQSMRSGAATRLLERYIETTQRLREKAS